ncbi:MAG: uracil-DNA glycosylase family protein [Betaproteobacteria bacterium]|nr:uracil-DNA glycosylase family protein [Betaproteobacteria bacterium]MCL2885236.1 uracil-DNA glycosylase family protein [Betaproteobacteria bacterium]
MKHIQDFVHFSEKTLSSILNEIGGTLYSSKDSLKRGDIYILGINPGGEGGQTIGDNLKELPQRTRNAYLDEAWEWPLGQAPLQRHIKRLADALGYDLRDVCASNLIFKQSRNESGVNNKDADTCWPVHEKILKIVQPKLILAFGNTPYDYLNKKLNTMHSPEELFQPAHGKRKCRAFKGYLPETGLSFFVVGIPHMSRYDPAKRGDIIRWLKSML